ncbi:hypothetical protein SAMN05444166_3674 [Singulisphaera sp. GP187]|uniref:hypothetical protein n=1 Tax=Singulisphaera sp. GP187 TaxID=1882752 RepID=UPI00092A153D|nr:hypothetical protein [Singulisphaera sp. GP187]SIO30941.1 hypothetical protein SAMN05444166_3674 [Singulisphaera sp. GP187]
MLKPLTLSLGLALALGFGSVSQAGLFGHDTGLASPQGVAPSPQYAPVVASAQCDTGCAPAKSCGLKNLFSGLHKPKVYSYEWVLKKKRVWGHKSNACGTPSCDTCGPTVFPSSQGYASPQGYTSPQSYSSPQAYGSGQAYAAPQATSVVTPAPASDEAPPAPEVAPTPAPAPPAPANAPQSSLLFSTPSGN